jgi:hypothetical protein
VSDDTKAAPSLADEFALLAKVATPGPWHISPLCAIDTGGAKFASLSDAVQNEMLEHPEGWLCETVQTHGAIHEFDANRADVDLFVFVSNNRDRILVALRAVDELQAWKRQHTEASCTNPICDCIEAQLSRATRAVEAVRVFPKTSPKQIVAENTHEAVAYAFGYRDGVEAVQALLEGER